VIVTQFGANERIAWNRAMAGCETLVKEGLFAFRFGQLAIRIGRTSDPDWTLKEFENGLSGI